MKFDTSGGFRWLDSLVMASIIQLATIRFCQRFLNRGNDPCGRQFDQMTQAARSGKENIIKGSERAATSKETEMKLTSEILHIRTKPALPPENVMAYGAHLSEPRHSGGSQGGLQQADFMARLPNRRFERTGCVAPA